MFALQDIISYGKEKQVYAKRGDEVQVFKRPHDTVWLCECNGVKFACAPDKLGEEKPVGIVEVKQTKVSTKKLTQAEKMQLKYLGNEI